MVDYRLERFTPQPGENPKIWSTLTKCLKFVMANPTPIFGRGEMKIGATEVWNNDGFSHKLSYSPALHVFPDFRIFPKFNFSKSIKMGRG